jgi:hypothetical protein
MKNDKVCISKKVGYFSLFVLFLIIAVLFMSQAAEQQKSTSSRATKANLKPIMNGTQRAVSNNFVASGVQTEGEGDNFCKTTNALNTSDTPGYSKSSDTCSAVGTYLDPLVKCYTTSIGGLKITGKACNRNGSVSLLGDARCASKTSDTNAKCRVGSCSGSESNLGVICGSASITGGLREGICCGNPNPTKVPVTTPAPKVYDSNTGNCGSSGVDCTKTLGSSAVCIGSAQKAYCGYKANGQEVCKATKYAYPIYTQNSRRTRSAYCLKEVIEISVKATDNNFYCSFAQTPVKTTNSDNTSTDDAARSNECKNALAPPNHDND